MKINLILYRYLISQMIPPFVINVVFLTFVFLMTKILDITNLIVNYKISIFTVFLMLFYYIPYFLEFVIPMSVMLAVLLTFLRMSGDNEIIALKAGGVGIFRFLPPVLIFCLMGGIFTCFIAVYGMPWAKQSFKALTFRVAASNLDIGLKERSFNDNFKNVMLYVNKIDLKSKEFIDVFIEDQRNPKVVGTIIGRKGKLFSEPGHCSYILRLDDGLINQVDLEKKSLNTIHFDTYEIKLDLKSAVCDPKSKPKDEKEMSLAELRQGIKEATGKNADYYSKLIEFHKKFSITFACFALGFLAVPLGMQSKTAKRSFGLGLGLFFFLLYYLLLSAGQVFGEAGIYPPVIGMWVPNIVIAAIGLYLFKRTADERPVKLAYFAHSIQFFWSRVAGRLSRCNNSRWTE